MICIDYRRYYAHRLAWFYVHGEWPKVVDHWNGKRDDNRLENLRDANDSINAQNRREATPGNTSGLLGVSWNTRDKKWVAQIRIDGKNTQIGRFDDALEGHRAYVAAKRQQHEGCTI